ncbi:MAG: transcriptional regulator NrdR [Mariprofundaceae bacterium]|nr:transcriptional regulator NrdR [Mariprofundaceae bacterium]
MHCPFCHHEDTRVIDSRVVEDGHAVRRRRKCENCKKRFSSLERIQLRLPLVIKRGGLRQPFDVEKIRLGMQKALEKRAITAQQLDQAVEKVLYEIEETAEQEMLSSQLALCVMGVLQALDGVAYVRFVSVYQKFESVEEFITVVRQTMQIKD